MNVRPISVKTSRRKELNNRTPQHKQYTSHYSTKIGEFISRPMDVEIANAPQGYQTRSSSKRKSEEGLETGPNKRRKVVTIKDDIDAIDLTLDSADVHAESRTSNPINNVPKNSPHQKTRGKKDEPLFDIKEAPVFHPTAEEFANPVRYVKSIAHLVEPYGICRIVPPKKEDGGQWDTECFFKNVNPNKFKFVTKAQNVHQMQKRRGHNVIFYKRLKKFMLEEKGKRTLKTYTVDGIEVDLYRLHLEILNHGGYDTVEQKEHWSDIATELRLPYCNSTVIATLRRSYQNCLKDFVENETEMEGFLQEINDNDAIYEERQRSKPRQLRERESKPKATQLSFSGARGIKSYGTRTHPMTSSDWKDIKLQSFGHNLKATIEDVTCTICGRGDRPDKLVVCDNNCNRGTHIHCMDPPLARVPKGEWLCEKCVKSTEEEREELEYGYDMGKQYTLTQFERMAMQFECNWFGLPYEQEESDDEDDDNDKLFKKQVRKQAKVKDWINPNVVEKEYWRIVEGTDDRVVVYYGSDVDVHEHGCSGFPLDTQSTAEPVRARALKTKGQFIRDATAEAMAKSGWNLNNLPYVSALKHLRQNISGVTRPMMYVGMLFSSFCWHTEDNLLYSINYVHMGKPKNWYGVAGRYAAKFEEVMKQTMPDLFEKHPNLLHMLITMLSPRILQANGIPVVRTIQNAGEFVITFPNAYHAGFNQGFNCAESVNFALPDWIEQGRTAVEAYRFKRSSVFPHAEFVISAALDLIKEVEESDDTASEDEDGSEKKTEQIAPYDLADFRPRIKFELERLLNKEREDRQRLQKVGLTRIVPLTTKQLKEECKQCDVCGFDCYVSGVVCDCNNAISFCLSHAEGRCSCEMSRKKIQYRFELKLLEEALKHLKEIMENSE